MKLLPLTIACPGCNSQEVAYTCSPSCCFNHVCANCYTTFEPFTRALGKELSLGDLPETEVDFSRPVVSCERCHQLVVYSIAEDKALENKLVCVSCHMLLELGFSNVNSR
ncbi:MAG TPA: hypothetical protein VNM22_02785 [Candidatus Limnocylindrales bacterium]|nr:hypothetical protein [Candidatus Limnocylindrales bacterium]